MSITKNTYDRIPGYNETKQALERATAWRTSLTRPSYEEPISVNSLMELAMMPDGELPADMGSRNQVFRDQKQYQLEDIRLVDETIKRLRGELKQRQMEGADKGLVYLDRTLQKLVKDVRAVPPEIAKLSEVEALKAGGEILDVWNSVDALISRYDEIRSLQTTLSRTSDNPGVVFQVGQLRNSLDFAPYWQDKRQRIDTTSALRDANEHVQNYAHWLKSVPQPAHRPASNHWPVGDRRAYLFTVCTYDLWVPSIEAMNEADKAATGATSRVSYNDLSHIEAARDRYYEVTGTPPAIEYMSSPGNQSPRKVRKATLGDAYFGSLL